MRSFISTANESARAEKLFPLTRSGEERRTVVVCVFDENTPTCAHDPGRGARDQGWAGNAVHLQTAVSALLAAGPVSICARTRHKHQVTTTELNTKYRCQRLH